MVVADAGQMVGQNLEVDGGLVGYVLLGAALPGDAHAAGGQDGESPAAAPHVVIYRGGSPATPGKT